MPTIPRQTRLAHTRHAAGVPMSVITGSSNVDLSTSFILCKQSQREPDHQREEATKPAERHENLRQPVEDVVAPSQLANEEPALHWPRVHASSVSTTCTRRPTSFTAKSLRSTSRQDHRHFGSGKSVEARSITAFPSGQERTRLPWMPRDACGAPIVAHVAASMSCLAHASSERQKRP